MSSTLIIRKTPEPPREDEWRFKQPVKGLLARKFYDHDGSLGGGIETVGPEHLDWFEGVLAASNMERRDRAHFEAIVGILRDGQSIGMWFEV